VIKKNTVCKQNHAFVPTKDMLDSKGTSSVNKMWYIIVYIVMFQDVMHTICASHGHIDKIVLFRKQFVQALVQYPFLIST